VDVDAYLAWMRGRLVFADTPVREVLPQLGRWYDVDLKLGDTALADARLSATLDAEALPEALHLLAVALDVRIERQGRTAVLYPRQRGR
jgi:transmembrane sensor